MEKTIWFSSYKQSKMRITEATTRAFAMSKALGMFPYNKHLEYSPAALVYSVIFIITVLVFAVYSSLKNTGETPIQAVVERLEFIFLTISILNAFRKIVMSRNEFKQLLSDYDVANMSLESIGLSTEYSNKYIYLSMSFPIIFLTLITLLDGVTSFSDGSYWITWYLFSYIGWLSQDSFLRQFTAVLNYLSSDFSRISRYLNNVSKEVHYYRGINKVELVASFHDSLTSICYTLNDLYSSQLFLSTTTVFLVILSSVHYIVSSAAVLIKGENYEEGFSVITESGRVILYTHQMLHICWTCNSVSEKANEFHHILYQIMKNDSSGTLSNNTFLLLHISMKRNVVFTAAGFFNLDLSLLVAMLGAATTYLVILIQFDPQKEEDQKNTNSTFDCIFDSTIKNCSKVFFLK